MNHTIRWMLATAAVLGCGIIASPVVAPRAAQAQVPPDQSAQVGRYQLTANNSNLYFLDTTTGRAWWTAVGTSDREAHKGPWQAMVTPAGRGR